MKGQKTTLGRTEIILPFSARISVVSIEKDQFVNVGNTLFEAQDIDGVEINAQLPIMHMRSLVSHLEGKTFDSPAMGKARQSQRKRSSYNSATSVEHLPVRRQLGPLLRVFAPPVGDDAPGGLVDQVAVL